MVNLDNIGNSYETGLICHTDYPNCCTGSGPYNLGSRWWYPGNRTVTSNRSSTEPFTRTRGIMSLSLYDRDYSEEIDRNNSEFNNRKNSELNDKNNSELNSRNNSELNNRNNSELNNRNNSESNNRNNSESDNRNNLESNNRDNSEINNRSITEFNTRNNSESNNRNSSEGNPPVGIYYCEIRNRSENIILQEIYVGVYPNNQGRIIQLSISFRLLCL